MTKDQLLASMLHEIRVARHLFAKLPPGSFDYRPTTGQRSTLELLRYLTYCGIGAAKAARAGTFEAIKPYKDAASAMPAGEFPEAMDRQEAALKEFFAGIDDQEYAGRRISFPPPTLLEGTLDEVLVNTSLKFLTGYRMQLFLYAKMAGAGDLDTSDCWRGTTNPQKTAEAQRR